MKKILLFMILLLLPFVVYGAECSNENIEIKDLELVTTNGGAEIINDAKIVDGKLVFDVRFSKLEDNVDYKVLIKNNSDEEFLVDENSIVSNLKNIKYTISFLEDSRVIEPGKEKYVILNIKYDTKVDDSLFNSDNEYPVDDNMSFSLTSNEKEVEDTEVPVYVPTAEEPKEIKNEVDQEKNIEDNTNEDNPLTNGSIRLVIVIAAMSVVVIALAIFGYRKESKALLILMILSLPLIAKAMCTVKVESNSHFVFEKYPVKKCYFDGELVKGAEYINGQYAYRYQEEATSSINWNFKPFRDMTTEGWSMRLVDYSSTDPVTTEMCVYVNDIPVTSMSYAFQGSGAPSIDLSSFNTTNIVIMQGTFRHLVVSELDLSTFDTSNVKTMQGMFALNENIKHLDVSNFNTSNVEDMGHMFSYNSFDVDLSSFDTRKVKSMKEMFIGSKMDVDLSVLDTSSLEDMEWMFYEYEGHVNLDGFNTSNVTNMKEAFYKSKIPDLDVSSFDTRNVTNMDAMFQYAETDVLNISNFNIDSLENVSCLFCFSTARVVDISGLRTTKLRKSTNMFAEMPNLEIIYASPDFDSSVLGSPGGNLNFMSNTKLKGGAGTDCSNVGLDKDITYMRIDGGESAPGCFTAKP